jgi:hypothetical protein
MSDRLPPEHHVLRYVKKSLLRRDGDDDTVIGILPQALERRDGEDYLSVTWIEHFSADYEGGFRASANAIRKTMTVKKGDGFAAGQVGQISATCEAHDIKVRIVHEPDLPDNPGHSGIRGLPKDHLKALETLADDVFVDTRVSSDIP